MAHILAIGRRIQTFRALRHRDYRWFWIGANAQALGRGMQFLILGWLVLELTESAARMGFMIFLYGMPTLGFVLFGGTFADRFDRRGLLMLTQAAVTILMLGIAVLQTRDLVALWHVYTAAFVLGTLQAINTPARLAIVRDLVDRDDLMNAVVLNSAVMNSGRIIGPAVAGAVIELAGLAPALWVATGCFFVGTTTLLMVRRVPTVARGQRAGIFAELWGGLRYCWSNPVTFTVIGIGFAFGFFAMPYAQLLPAFAKLALDTGAGGAGSADDWGGHRLPVRHVHHGVDGQLAAQELAVTGLHLPVRHSAVLPGLVAMVLGVVGDPVPGGDGQHRADGDDGIAIVGSG